MSGYGSTQRPPWRGLRLLTPATSEPLSLEAAKAHLRIEDSADDSTIAAFIGAARDHVERYTRRALIRQEWRLTLDEFPAGAIELPIPPVSAIASIAYLDPAGVGRTIDPAAYALVADQTSAVIEPAAGWPATLPRAGAVSVDYWTGYTEKAGDPDELIPASAKQAALLLIGHWYENREAVNVGNLTTELPFTVEALLAPLRSLRF